MGNGPRYKVQTRYGWFSLDEGSYRDYLAGKLTWINWPPLRDPKMAIKEGPIPPNVSPRAIELRDRATKIGLSDVLCEFTTTSTPPCRKRIHDLPIYEMNLSVRSSNGLMRAGVQTFGQLNRLIRSEQGIESVRNLGVKSAKEIRETFLLACYEQLLPYEKAEFWQEVLDLNASGLSDAG